MPEYISRRDTQKAINDLPTELDAETVQRCSEVVHNFPAADVVKVRHGRWKKVIVADDPWWDGEPYEIYECTNCGKQRPYVGDNYCPNCGARMDGGQDDAE